MCGIAGIVMRDGRTGDGRVAGRMADVMVHRGPDGSGVWANGAAALSHRRLAIIDLSQQAAQPMVSDDGRCVIVFNGEIYNYRALRGRLVDAGWHLRSTSDTEVLLGLYRVLGKDRLLEQLNGIFSFAIWDAGERRLFAARDHMGVKPFYYAVDRHRFLFASEVKALLAAGWPAAVDTARIPEQLAFGALAGEETLFKGVRRLPAGCWLELPFGREPKIGQYFDPAAIHAGGGSFDEAARMTRQTLKAAVERQMVADVPLGSTCSGGLDSSGLTALAASLQPGIRSYAVKVPVPRFDESEQSRIVSAHCGTSHHELLSGEDDVARLMTTLVWAHDAPLRYRASAATFQLARLARQDVKVLLSGEGADELFGGYSYYRRARGAAALHRHCPSALLRFGARYRSRSAALALARSPEELLVRLRAGVESSAVARVAPDLKPEWEARMAMARTAWHAAPADPTQAALLYDQLSLLPSMLACQDKMSMAASIETRVPFLDVELVRVVNSLPSRYKLRNGVDKAVLRTALDGVLPDEIRQRRKHAFEVPLERWMRQTAPDLSRRLGRGELVRTGVLRQAAITGVIAAAAGDRRSRHLLWHLLGLEAWWSIFITKTVVPNREELPAWRERPEVAAPSPSTMP
jgi:asparagine synthase (glutamine-hydrolysing)